MKMSAVKRFVRSRGRAKGLAGQRVSPDFGRYVPPLSSELPYGSFSGRINREKVAWFAVIDQFHQEQVLITKPLPTAGGTSCSTAMQRRGVNWQPLTLMT
jgi:hypothetical protein